MWKVNNEALVSEEDIQNSRCRYKDAEWAIVGVYDGSDVLTVGTIEYHKDFDCAIERGRQLNRAGSSVKVEPAGNGSGYFEAQFNTLNL